MPKLLDSSAAAVGEVKPWSAATAQDGWLLLSGLTISDAGNGGTALASAYARDLFVFLWNNYSNTELIIQTNGGVNTTRGANALADFTTNDRRMPLPDLRGRQWLGKDNMGGSAANRVTNGTSSINGATLGAVGGNQAMHQHKHTIYGATGPAAGSQGSLISAIEGEGITIRLNTTPADISSAMDNTGAGGSQNMSPVFVGTYVIKY